MQITVTLDATRPMKDLANELHSFANVLWDQPDATPNRTSVLNTPTASTDGIEKRAKKTKVAEPEESFDLGDDVTEEAEETLTLDDMILAFKAYAGKHTREKAGKILTKYGVKSVRDLKPEQYSEVLAILK